MITIYFRVMKNLRKQSFGSQYAVNLYAILGLVLNIVIIS